MLLKRDISAITARFRDAWAEYTKRRAPSRSHPIGEDATPEQFRAALAEFGIGNTKELAEAIGMSTRQAQYIMCDPSLLTAEHQRKLLPRAESDIDAQEQFVSWMDDETDALSEAYGMCPEDAPEYPKIEEDYDKAAQELASERAALDRMYEAYSLLSGDRYRTDAERAARLEFQARALLEGFNALNDADRCFILRTIDGMLSRYPGDEARNIRDVLGKTHFGRFARLRDLAKLVASREVLDQYDGWGSAIMEREILGEYVDGQK